MSRKKLDKDIIIEILKDKEYQRLNKNNWIPYRDNINITLVSYNNVGGILIDTTYHSDYAASRTPLTDNRKVTIKMTEYNRVKNLNELLD